jgi:hypothetical protein
LRSFGLPGAGSAEEMGILSRHGQGYVEPSRGLEDPILPLSTPTGLQLLNLRSSWKVSSANYLAMTELSEVCSLASTRNPYVMEKVFVQTTQQIRLAIMLYSDTVRKSVSVGVRTS